LFNVGKTLSFIPIMRFTKFIFAFLILVQSLGSAHAQVSCGGQQLGEGCIKYPAQIYQCIDGDFVASALYGTKLLPPVQAQNTAQFIIVKGKITFADDYTFAPGSDVVFLDNNSGFKVFNTKKLTLSSSWLHGCTKLWAGVEVLNFAKIVATNCTFEDAKATIILRNQSVAEITGNTFKKNVCSILGLSPNPGITSISIFLGSRRGISGNTFWGNHQLLEPIVPATIDIGINSDASTGTTNYPYIGIWIERVNSLSIGFLSNQSGVPFNSFLNFGKNKESGVKTHGIRSIQSNVNIQNSTFSNFGNYDPINSANTIEADAVFARNDGNMLKTDYLHRHEPDRIHFPQEPSNDFTCLTGKKWEGALAGSDIRLLNGTYSPPLNYPALTWEAKWQFAARLNRNPSLQTIDAATVQYFQNTYNDTYSRLNRAYQSYLDRWQPNAAMVSQLGALETAVEQRFALDVTLSENLEDNGTLHTQMLAADTDIADKTASLKTAMENWIATVKQNVNALLTEVNSVTTAQEHETDMKSVLSVMFQSHLAAGEISAQQTALMTQIAGKCRYSGGYAVLLARGFFEPQDSYSQDAACQSEERNSPVTSDISDLVALYPNPATESFVLSTGVPFEQGQVQVFNSQGGLVRSMNLTGIATNVSVSDLPDGVYYLHVLLDNGVAAHKTFVKIK